jgi:hypothetical protein
MPAGPNIILGQHLNTISAGAHGATIGGGGGVDFFSSMALSNFVTADFGTIGGGNANVAGAGSTNLSVGGYATVGGGYGNKASGTGSAIPGGALNEATGNYGLAAGYAANADHNGSFVWNGNPTSAHSQTNHRFHVYGTNGFYVEYWRTGPNVGPGGPGWVEIGPDIKEGFSSRTISTWTGAYLSDSGVWQSVSDRNRKTDFAQVDTREVLAQVVAVPVQSWRYTNEVQAVRHLGPTAQDFKAAFGLGADDTTIGTVDEAGVALAAIQGLSQKLEEKEAEIKTLEHRIVALERAMDSALARSGEKVSGAQADRSASTGYRSLP